MAQVIAVAYPQHEADRVRLSQRGTRPLPPLSVDGAQVLPCDGCAIDLNAGPNVQARMQALHLKLLCPQCAVREVGR